MLSLVKTVLRPSDDKKDKEGVEFAHLKDNRVNGSSGSSGTAEGEEQGRAEPCPPQPR